MILSVSPDLYDWTSSCLSWSALRLSCWTAMGAEAMRHSLIWLISSSFCWICSCVCWIWAEFGSCWPDWDSFWIYRFRSMIYVFSVLFCSVSC